ncbi:MAG: hypothetical protein AAGA56_24435 [Myxococcota bacterium]
MAAVRFDGAAELFDKVPEAVVNLCRRLAQRGYRGWVVGGCVRDLLVGEAPKDWDIATDARPEQVETVFRKVIPTGIDHGTVTVVQQGVAYEVTTLRGEGAYLDGRRPSEVSFLEDIEQDLARRDFTFNAIALDPLKREVRDPFGGRADLERRCLRAVGVAHERFCEDGLRILRGARFAAVLECRVEDETWAAMGAERPLATLARVSAERVHDEWYKSMRAARPSIAFSIMADTGALALHAPELAACRAEAPALYERGLGTMDRLDGEPPALRLTGLLAIVAEREGEGALDALLVRLKFKNKDRQRIVAAARALPSTRGEVAFTPAGVRRWLAAHGPDVARDVWRVAEAEGTPQPALSALRQEGEAALAAGVALTTRDLAVDGAALMSVLDRRPGRWLGDLLAHLLDAVLEEPSRNERDELLAHARAWAEDRPES